MSGSLYVWKISRVVSDNLEELLGAPWISKRPAGVSSLSGDLTGINNYLEDL